MATDPRRLLGFSVLALVLLLAAPTARAQSWGEVAGQVTSTTGEGVPGATVIVERTNYGTASDVDGRFSMRIPTGSYRLRISAVGYRTRTDSVNVRRGTVALMAVRLASDMRELETVVVEADRAEGAGVFEIRPEDVQNLPGPFRSAFQAVRVLPGVAANNELSNQFSVRGGGLSENLIFLNGFEVYLPFRPKQGEQEGLGILNPDLTESLTLYAGGFPARYGGKLSSALDVRYLRPEAGDGFHGSGSVSLLDAGVSASGAVGRLGIAAGVRRAQAGRLFGTQALKGRYRPAFTDGQLALNYRLAPGHEVEAVGLVAAHRFNLDPTTRNVYSGIVSSDPNRPSNFQSVYTQFDANSFERDGFNTVFGGVRLKNRVSSRVRVEHDVSLFETDEFERVQITGTARLSQVDPFSGDERPIGDSRQEDRIDNRIRVRTITGQGRYFAAVGSQALEAGWVARRLRFDDRLDEFAIRTDARTNVRVVLDSLNDASVLDANQFAGYAQDAFDLIPSAPGRLTATAGVRADYFDFNDEWTISPRLAARFKATDVTTFSASAGLYYQAPTYQEFRGQPRSNEPIDQALNRDLRSQRSLQFVAGGEHFLTGRRLWLRGEAYYKGLSDLVSYNVENVRVRYSGENDASGHIYGFDLQVRGEFVPGLESWVNYGFLVAREEFGGDFLTRFNEGALPRPTDQRHTLSAYVQDYVPNNPTWRLHLRGLFGSGYPYTPLIPSKADGQGNAVFQVYGPRNSFRYSGYRRVDMGGTKEVTFKRGDGREAARLDLTAELLNIFDMENEVAFQYTSFNGKWQRTPVRLTPRTVNVRMRVTF